MTVLGQAVIILAIVLAAKPTNCERQMMLDRKVCIWKAQNYAPERATATEVAKCQRQFNERRYLCTPEVAVGDDIVGKKDRTRTKR